MVDKLLELFMQKNCKKQTKKIGKKKWYKEKETNYMSICMVLIINIIAELVKMMLYKYESILS